MARDCDLCCTLALRKDVTYVYSPVSEKREKKNTLVRVEIDIVTDTSDYICNKPFENNSKIGLQFRGSFGFPTSKRNRGVEFKLSSTICWQIFSKAVRST